MYLHVCCLENRLSDGFYMSHGNGGYIVVFLAIEGSRLRLLEKIEVEWLIGYSIGITRQTYITRY